MQTLTKFFLKCLHKELLAKVKSRIKLNPYLSFFLKYLIIHTLWCVKVLNSVDIDSRHTLNFD